MNYSQQDIWMMQFAEFFITRCNYTSVAVQQAKNEIWLVNPKQVVYPIIRLTKNDVDSEYFDRDRILQIQRAILDMFKREGKRLDIHMTLGEENQTSEDADHIHMMPGHKPSAELLAMFPGLGSVCHNVEDSKQAYIQLSKSIESFQMNTFKKERKKLIDQVRKIPYATIGVGAICIIIYLLGLLFGLVSDDRVAISIMLGSYYKAFIVGMNQWWRLLTAGFVHIDFFHLLMNMMALYYLGGVCEQIYGKKRYLMILVGAILVGNVFVFIGDGNIVSLGISGGLYGLMAATMIYFFSSGLMKQPAIRRQFINMLLINIMISFLPGISMLGHFGGFVGGLFLSMLATENKQWKEIQKHFKMAFLALCILMGVLMAKTATLNDVYYGTDIRVVQIAEKLHMDRYANHIRMSMLEYYK